VTQQDNPQDAEQPRRPTPGPSPTSRARRAAAAGGQPPRRRPRPAAARAAGGGPMGGEPAAAGVLTEQPPAPEVEEHRSVRVRAAGAPLWLAVVLGVLVLIGVAATVLAATLPSGAGSTGQRDQALSAAKTEVPLILSYSYKTFDADVAKAKAQLTGRAVTDYGSAMASSIKPTALKAKAVVQAQTDGAGVESVSPDGQQVTVVVFGEQKVTNSSLSAPRTDLFRVRATLNLVSGRWLVAKFDQI